ncbi:unnamed protein product, partial [Choristocarpus tenellus]
MELDNSQTSLTYRLRKKQRQTAIGPAAGSRPRVGGRYDTSIDVAQIVPERPIPKWIHGKGKKKSQLKDDGRVAMVSNVNSDRTVTVKWGLGNVLKLDHKNMRKDWKPASSLATEAVYAARIQENRRPEGVRGFSGDSGPFQIHMDSPVTNFASTTSSDRNCKRFGVSPANGHQDAIVETDSDSSKDFNKQDIASRLPDDSGYLCLDQSKLPLEIFDGGEDTDGAKTSQALLASGSAAMAPYFSKQEWQWRPCAVLSFNNNTQTYLVSFLPKGPEKEVKRFNLLFDAESREKWEDRRKAAEASRESAKQRLRFDYFVSQQPMQEVRAIQGSTLRDIHAKVADGLPLDVAFPEQGTHLGFLLRDLTKEVIQQHARSMKKAILMHKLERSEPIRERYEHLGLPPVPQCAAVPWVGKEDIPTHPYKERRKAISNIHYSCMPEVLGVFLWLHAVWEGSFSGQRFMDTELEHLTMPCEISKFCEVQSKCRSRLGERLLQDWRRAFSEQLVDSVQDIFDFFQSDEHIFKASALFRLLKHLELRMSFQLRHIFKGSLTAWKEFVTEHTPDAEEANFEVTGCIPLFDVSLQVMKKTGDIHMIHVHPGLLEVQGACMQLVDDMVDSLKSYTTIDTDLMSLLHLNCRPIFNFGKGDAMYIDVEAELDDARVYIMERLTRAMKGPQNLADMYGRFCHLLDIDTEEYIDFFNEMVPTPSSDDYFAKVREFHEASVAISSCSMNHELFKLVRVNTIEVTQILKDKAQELRDALLESIVGKVRDQNHDIISRYESILARIVEKPANEAELAALRDFIKESKAKVSLLILEVREVHARLAALAELSYRISEEDIRLSWRTMDYPTMVDLAAKKAEEALELDKVRMMDKLALEKENFEEILERFEVDVARAKECGDYNQMDANTDYVNSIQDAINDAKAQAEDFNSREKASYTLSFQFVFGFPPTEYSVLGKVETELEQFYRLWNMVSDFHANHKEWMHGPFLELNGANIEREVTEWWKSSYRMSKTLEDEFPAAAKCAGQLREDTNAFREHLPVIQALASPALKPRHWEQLSDKIGSVIEPDEELTLQQLVEMKVGRHIETIQEVCVAAEKEYGLEKALAGMKEEWTSLEFEVRPYKETGTYLVSGVDEIITLLDDHIVKTQTMRGSPYIVPVEAECKAWEYRLKYAQGLVDEWVTCQRTWLYLEPIFSSEDIMRQLPTEARRFSGVDQLWRKTMEETNKDPIFMVQADPEKKLEEKFKAANHKLEEIQKGLSDYLEMKRLYFPRFFFLSNDELLEILSQTKEPRAVQPHLNKAFEGIAKCKFEDDLKITQMISAEGEIIVLDNAVDPESTANKGSVERWLLELEVMQWQSVRTQVTLSLAEYPTKSREEWVLNWPAQAVLGISQVLWTEDVSTSIKNGGVKGLNGLVHTLNTQLRNITLLVRGKLSSLQRRTLGALCTIDVHARDTVVKMAELGVCHEDDFNWVSQLRYYWSSSWKDGQAVAKGDQTLVVRIVNAKCLYGYEYLGNTMRLVITPLTDRCYRTMIGAIDLLYGGAPEGPAGTGKTETVKDLSKAVAIQCVVFNCSDGLDYLAMAKFFKGLAGCGSWCCFDEFNRINIEVLSVIAQQILTINKAKKAQVEKFHFEGTFMKINHNANAFITMNPGYAGRAELPDNLKALFRPCAMMVPDYSLISEIRLYSFGFENARENAQKLVRVLQLCSEQLSSQKHYDYGMRAVNSILVAAGNLRQQLGDDPGWNEAKIVLRSVNDINLPKFTVEDLPLFKGITSDLFPGVNLGESDHGPLLGSIEAVCAEGVTISPGRQMVLIPKLSWKNKIVQLYEMVLVRHGVMIVGQTGSGKTCTVHTLASAMSHCNKEGSTGFPQVQVHTMNPKSISSGQLYGNFDDNTHEWSDGILAVIYRNCSKDLSPDRKWLMFDGPVDAVWIENMNTVLDDNKKLCLMSGEIVKMSDSMTMMFEAEDLEEASPATVSRVGMIFCEIQNLDWQPLRDVWLDSLPAVFTEYRDLLVSLFDWLFPPALYYVQKRCIIPTPVTGQELAASLIRLLGVLLDTPDGYASDMVKVLECLFIESLVWSVGACVDGKGREKFNQYLRMLMEGAGLADSEEHKDFQLKNLNWVQREHPLSLLPSSDGSMLYDYSFDAKKGQWKPWLEKGERYVIARDATFNSIVVPTLDTVRNEYLISTLLTHGHHVLCTGDTGTGKSVTVKKMLLFGMGDKYNTIMLNFSAQTTANQTQDIIDSKLDKRRKGVLGPPLGTTCIVFVDDLNMPAKEEYGAQPPIEILRQWMDHGGWYNRSENTFRQIVDVQYITAMGPPGGGRTSITQRYVRHFNLLNFVPFSNESLQRVFSTILDWFLQKGFNSSVKQVAGSIVAVTVDIYNTIAENLLPTPDKSHYTFNLRDLSKVFQGVLQGNSNFIFEKEQFIRLWAHECLRVFYDRLVDDRDRAWFKQMLAEKVKTYFNMDYNGSIRGVNEVLVYGNFSDPKGGKVYQEIEDHEALAKIMEDYLEDHNAMTSKPMSLVLFQNAIEHIARISRIICQPMGNALLVGVGGSGRKSLTALAASIADYKLFQIEISKSYNMIEWREDLKKVLTMAGAESRATVFLFDDTQIVQESFLEDINGILNTGEVPSLFNNEEMVAINEVLTKPAQ